MIVPVYCNNVDGSPTSAQGVADIVTYISGTRKYGVSYWTIGDEGDIYDQFFKRKTGTTRFDRVRASCGLQILCSGDKGCQRHS